MDRHRLGRRAQRAAEAVAALLLATIFVAFIVQIVFRYVFDLPVGWTSELSVAAWLWLVLWGAAFVLKDEDEIRFDMLSGRLGRRGRIAAGLVGALAMVLLFGLSLKASWSYVSFMAVERSSYLKVRMDWMYSIYIVFVLAVIARYGFKLVQLLRGRDPGAAADATQSPSAL
jgi:TRAP-type C4-dicarboxylate transport system permease small subunit